MYERLEVRQKFLLLSLFLIISLFLTGCGDRFISVSGTVYEWVNAPVDTKSETFHQEWIGGRFVGQEIPDGRTLVPVSNASLRFTLDSDFTYDPILSDSEGNYLLSTTWPPFQGNVLISVEVSKEGYYIAEREFVDHLSPHRLDVILVRKHE